MNKVKYKAPFTLEKGHTTDSGYDIKSNEYVVLKARETRTVKTGLYLEIAKGFEGQVRPKSSLSSQGIEVRFGTVDEDYRGEIGVIMTNTTNKDFKINIGRKIAQIVFVERDIVELEQVDEISKDTSRGTGGFGSTGKF